MVERFVILSFLIIYFDVIIIKIIRSLSLIIVLFVDDMLKRDDLSIALKFNLIKIDRGAYLIAILMYQCFVKFFFRVFDKLFYFYISKIIA